MHTHTHTHARMHYSGRILTVDTLWWEENSSSVTFGLQTRSVPYCVIVSTMNYTIRVRTKPIIQVINNTKLTQQLRAAVSSRDLPLPRSPFQTLLPHLFAHLYHHALLQAAASREGTVVATRTTSELPEKVRE